MAEPVNDPPHPSTRDTSTLTPMKIQWLGWDADEMPSATAILQCHQGFTEEQEREYLPFYYGEQWSNAVRLQRELDHRPTLVVNRLPQLVAASLDTQKRTGVDALIPIERLKAIIAFCNADAQRLYNYAASMSAEVPRLFESATAIDAVATDDGVVEG